MISGIEKLLKEMDSKQLKAVEYISRRILSVHSERFTGELSISLPHSQGGISGPVCINRGEMVTLPKKKSTRPGCLKRND